MPTPEMARENLPLLVQQAAVLQRAAYPQIAITTDLPASAVAIDCDRGLVAQCLTNVIKNAIESVEERKKFRAEPPGAVRISVRQVDDVARVEIADNGIGLPETGREKLVEPYVTTRSKGTGLGLAIVQKIMEEHDGRLRLEDNRETGEGGESDSDLDTAAVLQPTQGARIILEFPVAAAAGIAQHGEGGATT
jgi:two-component system nitrogen regulation sensor histidine kinase NtrY